MLETKHGEEPPLKTMPITKSNKRDSYKKGFFRSAVEPRAGNGKRDKKPPVPSFELEYASPRPSSEGKSEREPFVSLNFFAKNFIMRINYAYYGL